MNPNACLRCDMPIEEKGLDCHRDYGDCLEELKGVNADLYEALETMSADMDEIARTRKWWQPRFQAARDRACAALARARGGK